MISLPMSAPIQHIWPRDSHEAKVEKFYGSGAENYGDFHGGYLNFGLWENGTTSYVDAAKNMVKTLCQMSGLDRSSYLLDAACGMGAQNIFIHETFGCRIEAIDVCWKHVTQAVRRIKESGFENQISVLHETATRLPFPDKTFTQVLSVEGPQHFNTRVDFLQEARRVLKPKGKLAVSDFVLKREPKGWLDRFFVEMARKLWHVPLANREMPETYGKTLERNGFTDVSIRKIGNLSIPGYFFEQRKKETLDALKRIRGRFITWGGMIIDAAVYHAYKTGLIEYLLVSATKAGDKSS